ncbi:MAG: energy-coupling factor ABC transporter ATP-binding protein, partial [Oscillospiraceae bacterium]|nr:energy-coupling factor ABC transporter ATP-binding protein [Oscillospiraceae bacterium]
IFRVEDLNFTYPECSSKAVHDVSFKIGKGEFIVLCGSTGSGKSTLLRLLKPEISPNGETTGNILFHGAPLSDCSGRRSASSIGFVMQSPEQQIVTDKVWHELAFGLENLGVPPAEISRRTAETASFFGIGKWYGQNTADLSGGQKQLLNLASVLVMSPEIIILDEPTAQLDPIAASEFINALKRLNEELSLTVVIAEHRLEEVVPLCDRIMVMDEGKLIFNGEPRKIFTEIKNDSPVLRGLPAAARLYGMTGGKDECPLTVREGRKYIESTFKNDIRTLPDTSGNSDKKETALEFKNVRFRYSRDGEDILRDLSFKVNTGEIFCILGGNGCGKTTSLRLAADLAKPYSGVIKVFGKKLKEYRNRSLYKECLALLPQDVQTVFLCDSVREELEKCGADTGSLPFNISGLLDKHPYDLSGGEQQAAALARILAAKPKLLLMDEPTKGLDADWKSKMKDILNGLKEQNVTVVIVTHDIEFAAECADRCAMFFDGRIVSEGTPEEFFSANSFYTTAVSRMTREMYDNIVTVSRAAEICTLNGRKDEDHDSH